MKDKIILSNLTVMPLFLKGVRCISVAIILAAIIGISLAEAGNFFAETPKHAPRLGRRSGVDSQIIPMKKAQRMKYFYAEIPKAMPRIGRRSQPVLQETPAWDQRSDSNNPCWDRRIFPGSASVNFDQDEMKCLTLREFLQLNLPFMKDAAANNNFDDTATDDDDYGDWYEREFEGNNIPITRGNRHASIRELLRQEG